MIYAYCSFHCRLLLKGPDLTFLVNNDTALVVLKELDLIKLIVFTGSIKDVLGENGRIFTTESSLQMPVKNTVNNRFSCHYLDL